MDYCQEAYVTSNQKIEVFFEEEEDEWEEKIEENS